MFELAASFLVRQFHPRCGTGFFIHRATHSARNLRSTHRRALSNSRATVHPSLWIKQLPENTQLFAENPREYERALSARNDKCGTGTDRQTGTLSGSIRCTAENGDA